jgi:hypothetical protein
VPSNDSISRLCFAIPMAIGERSCRSVHAAELSYLCWIGMNHTIERENVFAGFVSQSQRCSMI